jgi:hypothetical protein
MVRDGRLQIEDWAIRRHFLSADPPSKNYGAASENDDECDISFKRFTLFTLLKLKHLNVYRSFTNRLQPGQVIEYE